MRIALSLLFISFLALVISCRQDDRQIAKSNKKTEQVDSTIFLHANAQYDSFGFRTDTLEVEDYDVKHNESFYLILDKFGFSPKEIYSITQDARHVMDVRNLRPGQHYRVYASADKDVISKLVWQPNPVDYVVFNWQDSLNIYKASQKITTRESSASATINSSLYEAIYKENLSPMLAYKLSDIFAWEINFFGLRKGDRFKVVYEKKYINDEFYDVGDIKAVLFNHMGHDYYAYKFENDDVQGYFDENGNSVQKALLKTPFKYDQRISSGFSFHRFHPILKRRMPHTGIDYAAPYGTPVLSVGDGVVTEAHYGGAAGNIVKIRHNITYSTAYMHLKGFARGIRRGGHVTQGQIIGYVGHTGRVTGTHLHYSMYKNNHAVNPKTVELPASESIPQKDISNFEQVRNFFNAKLEKSDESKRRELSKSTAINSAEPFDGKNS